MHVHIYIYICILVFVAWLHLYGIVTAIVGPHKSGYYFQTDTISINSVMEGIRSSCVLARKAFGRSISEGQRA